VASPGMRVPSCSIAVAASIGVAVGCSSFLCESKAVFSSKISLSKYYYSPIISNFLPHA